MRRLKVLCHFQDDQKGTWESNGWIIITFFMKYFHVFNLYIPNASFFYPLKTWCFQEAEKGCIGSKWVNMSIHNPLCVRSHFIWSSAYFPVDKRGCFNVDMSYDIVRRRIDVETTSSVYGAEEVKSNKKVIILLLF